MSYGLLVGSLAAQNDILAGRQQVADSSGSIPDSGISFETLRMASKAAEVVLLRCRSSAFSLCSCDCLALAAEIMGSIWEILRFSSSACPCSTDHPLAWRTSQMTHLANSEYLAP